ncbi:hypothetical protein LCGC14_0516660 [marine sediment metagenome]|uniref:Uncharacterized protein n=1 Tax=marine sediment metagenome TaxID=412755 RepID=A0A0F9V803_9ZZZZ
MDKTETKEIDDLIRAYRNIGGILMSRLKSNMADFPDHMGGAVSSLRTHTSLMHHVISSIHANITEDVPDQDRDKYEVEIKCGIRFIVEGVKTRKEAVDQVESGYYDEHIGALIGEALGKGRFREVEKIRPVDEEKTDEA